MTVTTLLTTLESQTRRWHETSKRTLFRRNCVASYSFSGTRPFCDAPAHPTPYYAGLNGFGGYSRSAHENMEETALKLEAQDTFKALVQTLHQDPFLAGLTVQLDFMKSKTTLKVRMHLGHLPLRGAPSSGHALPTVTKSLEALLALTQRLQTMGTDTPQLWGFTDIYSHVNARNGAEALLVRQAILTPNALQTPLSKAHQPQPYPCLPYATVAEADALQQQIFP
jgi:hypothetical protein